MEYSFVTTRQEGYLHARIRGKNDVATHLRYIDDVVQACAKAKCPNVLIEENLEGPRLSLGDIFQVISEKIGSVRSVVEAFAFVDVNAESSPSNQSFGEDVAVNRGVKVRAFPTVAEAERWLREKIAERS